MQGEQVVGEGNPRSDEGNKPESRGGNSTKPFAWRARSETKTRRQRPSKMNPASAPNPQPTP